MIITCYSTKPYDERSFTRVNERFGHTLHYLEARLDATSAPLAKGSDAVCCFVNDDAGAATLEQLAALGVKILLLRCAGFNQVDLEAAKRLGIRVARVPAYSPHAVAEYAVGLLLMLNRKLHRAYNRVREGNFALDGLLGFDLYGKTVGIMGTGRIGLNTVRILHGFGCRVIAFDKFPTDEAVRLGATYVSVDELLAQSDVISLHVPLTPENHHLIGAQAIAKLKPGVIIINTSRGGLIDTRAAIEGLKIGRIGGLGLDVYERERELFFEDRSQDIIPDDLFARLLTFPNVVITGHQAFFTQEALANIAEVTLQNGSQLGKGEACANSVG
jgi:D-lactate dehydrogenase